MLGHKILTQWSYFLSAFLGWLWVAKFTAAEIISICSGLRYSRYLLSLLTISSHTISAAAWLLSARILHVFSFTQMSILPEYNRQLKVSPSMTSSALMLKNYAFVVEHMANLHTSETGKFCISVPADTPPHLCIIFIYHACWRPRGGD